MWFLGGLQFILVPHSRVVTNVIERPAIQAVRMLHNKYTLNS